MKKWFVLALIVCIVGAVQAADEGAKKKGGKGGKDSKPVSKTEYVAQQKKMAEKKGEEFDQAKIEAKFDKMDKNKDGKLSADEMPEKKGKKSKSADE